MNIWICIVFYQIYTYNILFFINLIIYDIVLYLVVEVGDRHGICIAAFSRRSWRPMPLMSTPSTTMLPSWNIARLFQRLFVFCLLVAYCCIMSANLVPAPDSPFNCLLRLCQVLARRLPRLRQSKKCFLMFFAIARAWSKSAYGKNYFTSCDPHHDIYTFS